MTPAGAKRKKKKGRRDEAPSQRSQNTYQGVKNRRKGPNHPKYGMKEDEDQLAEFNIPTEAGGKDAESVHD